MFGSIFIDNKDAEQSLSKTEEKTEGLGAKLLKGAGTAAKWGAAIGGAAIAGGAALMGMAKNAAANTDRIDKMSQKIGISGKAFGELPLSEYLAYLQKFKEIEGLGDFLEHARKLTK